MHTYLMRVLVVTVVLTVHAILLAWQGWTLSPTIDEPAHLVAGISHWKFRNFRLYQVNPPLVRLVAALPVMAYTPELDWSEFSEGPYHRPEFRLGESFVFRNRSELRRMFAIARWACIPFSVIGGLYCYRWSSELFGTQAGVVAMVLWSAGPNILGNGSLITPDVPSAALGIVAGYYFWHWCYDPSIRRCILSGVTCGLALLTKLTWLVLLGIFPTIFLIRLIVSGTRHLRVETPTSDSQSLWSQRFYGIGQLVLWIIVCIDVVNAGYLFENSFQRLDSYSFVSQALGGKNAHRVPGNRMINTAYGRLRVPFPASYLVGIDIQRHEFEVGKTSYLQGDMKHGGWWYYYLYAMAVKMPVSTIIMIFTALLYGMKNRLRFVKHGKDGKKSDMHCLLRDSILLFPVIAVVILVSSQTGFNRYFRYTVPALPFLFVWTSQIVSIFSNTIIPKRFVICLIFCSVLSSLSCYPHSLSYFNIASGGPRQGGQHLLDANLDWGQDLYYLKQWCREHPEAKPLHIARFGSVDPNWIGMESVPSCFSKSSTEEERQAELRTGMWYAIGMNHLYGYLDSESTSHYYEFRDQQAFARVGYSIMVFKSQVQETE